MQGQTAKDFFTFEAVKDEKTCMALITLQPFSKSGVMPQMKAMYILFHMLYVVLRRFSKSANHVLRYILRL